VTRNAATSHPRLWRVPQALHTQRRASWISTCILIADKFPWNIAFCLINYTASHPAVQETSQPLPWEPRSLRVSNFLSSAEQPYERNTQMLSLFFTAHQLILSPWKTTYWGFGQRAAVLSGGATDPSGPGSPHYRGFMITFRHATFSTTPLDEWSARRRDPAWQHKTNATDFPDPARFEPTIPASYQTPSTHSSIAGELPNWSMKSPASASQNHTGFLRLVTPLYFESPSRFVTHRHRVSTPSPPRSVTSLMDCS
jgi:hypothetical protein